MSFEPWYDISISSEGVAQQGVTLVLFSVQPETFLLSKLYTQVKHARAKPKSGRAEAPVAHPARIRQLTFPSTSTLALATRSLTDGS